MNHTDWLENEYVLFENALLELMTPEKFRDFKSDPMVRRMLSEDLEDLFLDKVEFEFGELYDLIEKIDNIGRGTSTYISGACVRMVYYAQTVLKQNPSHIVEIGGGVGQFYAILRALGYQGEYFIYDRPKVQEFQRYYLKEVEQQTGLSLPLTTGEYDYCVSFYALGEFSDELKSWYFDNVIDKVPHGLILYNPHSGASPEVPLSKHEFIITPEEPTTHPNNKMIVW